MQKMVDTLYILTSSRGEYAISDLIAAIAWTSHGSFAIYGVDDRTLAVRATASLLRVAGVQFVSADLAAPPAAVPVVFQSLRALDAAITGGLVFRQAILLPDTSLIIGQGLDEFGLRQLGKTGALLMGVRDARDFSYPWRNALGAIYAYQLPHEGWETAPTTLTDAVLFLSYAGATRLQSRGACRGEHWAAWPSSFGAYLSWWTQLLDGNILCWGSTEKTLPPLYHCEAPNPPPHILSSQFLVYGTAGGVRGYSERDLRELYKEHRGEPAEPVAAYGPFMAGRLLPAAPAVIRGA